MIFFWIFSASFGVRIKIGLSDHQKPLAPVLGAVANGATVIERHFSDDPSRVGADHRVALGPIEWSNMVLEIMP